MHKTKNKSLSQKKKYRKLIFDMFTKIKNNSNSKKISHYFSHRKLTFLLLGLLVFINYVSYMHAFNFFFMHDDLAMLWSSTYNPADFFLSTVGPNGILLTGVFHYLIFKLYAVFPSSFFWQCVGFSIRLINVVSVYFLLTELMPKRYAYMGALLLAAFAGGIESYTWHPATALAVMFSIVTFYFYFKFIRTQRYIFLFNSSICMLFAFLSYIGRAMGIVIFMFIFNILYMLFQRSNLTRSMQKKLLWINFILILVVLFIMHISPSQRSSVTIQIIVEGIKSPSIYFESMGNLLQIPYLKTVELGGLAQQSNVSLFIGIMVLILGIIISIYSYVKKSQWGFNVMIGVLWIYIMYIFNWFFGGGNTSTLVGSIHRYVSMSAIGVIIVTALLLQKVPKRFQVLVLIILLFLNIRFTQDILINEGSIRDKSIVEPIYKTIVEKTKDDNNVQFLVVDTPNKLKSFVVQGWMPYAFAYYKGLPKLSEFPIVFPDVNAANEWLCSGKDKRIAKEKLIGIVNYRQDQIISPSHIYSWHVEENGAISDHTDELRNTYDQCLQKDRPDIKTE
jgi:hypothetical protein